MKFRIIINYISIIFISSCTSTFDKTRDFSIDPSEKIIRLPIDFRTSNISSFLIYHSYKNSELLFNLNKNLNEIQVFDLQNGTLIKRLVFDMEGSKGVGQIESFYIKSLDSIYLFPRYKPSFFLTDSSGIVREKITYTPPMGYTGPKYVSTYFSVQPKLFGNQLLVKTFYEGNYTNLKNEELSSKHLSFLLDLSDGKIEFTNHTFPDSYWEDYKKHYDFSIATSPDKVVYSFFADDNLYYSDSPAHNLQNKKSGSSFSNGNFDFIPLNGTREDRARYFSTTSHYGNLLYDKFRDLFIRFYYPEVENSNDRDLRTLARFSGHFVIMIYDNELNLVEEYNVPNNRSYAPANSFVAKEGIYISINHPDNIDNKEDYLSFQLFTIKK